MFSLTQLVLFTSATVEENIPSFLVLKHGLILHATGDEREGDSISVSNSVVELIGVDSVGFGWHYVDCFNRVW